MLYVQRPIIPMVMPLLPSSEGAAACDESPRKPEKNTHKQLTPLHGSGGTTER